MIHNMDPQTCDVVKYFPQSSGVPDGETFVKHHDSALQADRTALVSQYYLRLHTILCVGIHASKPSEDTVLATYDVGELRSAV